MELDETGLTQLVLKILKQLNIEEIAASPKQLYVVLPDEWNEKEIAFFQTAPKKYEVNTVVSSKLFKEDRFQKLFRTGCCGNVIQKEQVDFCSLKPGVSVFPVVPRDLLVKSALCISDTFESRWVRHCIEQGWKIVFLKQGMDSFTGKEPKAYTDCIKRYCRSLREYGIVLSDSLQEPKGEPPFACKAFPPKERAQVVTCGDLEQYAAGGKLIVQKNALITPLAKERALELGLEIIQK